MSTRTQIAVAGFGLVGRRHAEVIRRAPDMVLSAIVEPGQDSQIAARDLDVPVYASLEKMLSVSKPDGVVLATPKLTALGRGSFLW